ncbi:MAG: transferase [Desulfobacteraceae bacterium]|nr:transferase [Desulfobacteraceae bacterium]
MNEDNNKSQLTRLNDRIVSRVNVNLDEFDFDTESFVKNNLEHDKMLKFYAFYGITSQHPIYFHFRNSNIAGSYFLGKCYVGRSAIYKSDIRGDELKRQGDSIRSAKNIPLVEDEMIAIRDSLLYKTLVHSNSHNPESPEEFGIRNTISAHYANIHGSTLEGCFLGPFATVDLMNLHSCIVGEFSYVQAGELFHRIIDPGTVWVRSQNFEFKYKFKKEVLDNFVGVNSKFQPRGIIYDFVKERESDYEELFDLMNIEPVKAPASSAVNRYAVVKGKTRISENVLISQRAFLDNAVMGKGSNAQENSYIINSTLTGNNVTAHGGKIIHATMGFETFVGFNSFLNGKEDAPIEIGEGCIVMPHTIIDPEMPITIPAEHLVWGFIGSKKDLETQMISLDDLAEVRDSIKIGKMTFTGKGSVFIDAFRRRINHILLENGALFENGEDRGHAQDDQNISFNIIQPYRTGERKGLYPSIRIKP